MQNRYDNKNEIKSTLSLSLSLEKLCLSLLHKQFLIDILALRLFILR